MRTRCVIMLLLLFPVVNMIAQADSILALPEAQRMEALFNWNYLEKEKDRKHAIEKSLTIGNDFKKKGEDQLQKWAYALYTQGIAEQADEKQKMVLLSEQILEARRHGWKDLEAEFEYFLALLQYDADRNIPKLENLMEKFATIEKTGFSSPFTQHSVFSSLGHMAYTEGDYPLAIEYLRQAESAPLPQNNLRYDHGPSNILGLCFEKIEEYDSAIHYYQKSLTVVREHHLDDWIGLITGNMGSAYYKKGDYEHALPCLETDYQMSLARSMIGSAVNASTLLANLELKKGNTLKAEAYIQFAKNNIDTSSLGQMILYYDNLRKYSTAKKDYENALYYADQLQRYRKRQEKIYSKELVERANTKVQIAQYSRDVQLLKASRSRQLLLRNALFVIFLLTGIVALLLVKRIEYIRRTNKEKLDKAQAELNRFTKSLLEKNELIQSLREKQEAMPAEPGIAERYQNITALTHASIFTEEDWKHFRTLFDEVYPGFFAKLQEKFLDLTPAELRLLALTKLQIATKDMAEMLGISIDSIKKTKYRLRKKINLPEEGSLEELVSSIEHRA